MWKFGNNKFFLPILIVISFPICYVTIFTSLVTGVERPYTCSPKSKFDVFFMSDYSKAWSTHPTKVILFSSMWLFLNIYASLTFLNVVLNGLKQYTCNGCRTCDVWDGKVIMSNPKVYVYSIIYGVTWLPCPFITNKCLLVKNIPLIIDFLNKDKNSLNM
jgi:hypothetical protein